MDDLISRQAAIDAILAVTGNSSVRELYEHVQEHGLSDMWSGGVNAAIDVIIAVPSAQPEPCEDAVSRDSVSKWLDRWEGYIDKDMINRMQYKVCDIPSVKPDIPTVDTPTVVPTCEDTISRQDAIRVASGYCHPANIAKELAKLPSAQADSKELSPTHKALDTISRQSAIDAVYKCDDIFVGDMPVMVVKADAYEALAQLPSAQPDLSEYSDKLWQAAYERGKAEAQPDLDEVYAHAETEAEARYHAQQRWIPCSERLPEDGRQVLVYAISVHFALAKYDEMRNADGIYSMQWVTFDAWKPFYTIKDVVAWMPLPEPYAERRTDEAD